MTMLAALTLLPALLGFVGRNIDKLGLPHRKRAEGATRESFWFRWSHFIQRQPVAGRSSAAQPSCSSSPCPC